jgi:hypothetical protein
VIDCLTGTILLIQIPKLRTEKNTQAGCFLLKSSFRYAFSYTVPISLAFADNQRTAFVYLTTLSVTRAIQRRTVILQNWEIFEKNWYRPKRDSIHKTFARRDWRKTLSLSGSSWCPCRETSTKPASPYVRLLLRQACQPLNSSEHRSGCVRGKGNKNIFQRFNYIRKYLHKREKYAALLSQKPWRHVQFSKSNL